jgi:Spy/CpxP family protein refolding chaperone
MNFFHKNRLIFWVLIFLVVINISALISFFFFSKTQETVAAPCCSAEEQQCMAFRDELNLTAEQTLKVNAINKNYMETASPLATDIKNTRAVILTELEKVEPDTTQLNLLMNQLSLLQIKIQKENIRQFSELKRVCTPEQAHRLSALYRDLYGCPMRDGQMKHRNHNGQGEGNKTPCN